MLDSNLNLEWNQAISLAGLPVFTRIPKIALFAVCVTLKTLGLEIILVRGCENVAGKLRQNQQEPTSPNHAQVLFPGPVHIGDTYLLNMKHPENGRGIEWFAWEPKDRNIQSEGRRASMVDGFGSVMQCGHVVRC